MNAMHALCVCVLSVQNVMRVHVLGFFHQLALDTWKREMIEPTKDTLVRLVLDEIRKYEVDWDFLKHCLASICNFAYAFTC